jgi:UDP:flavonoid glycosyltransferase YjiC (YdhE family)
MKILFINLPYYGHVLPTIGLVQELIRKGCEVTYLMPFDWEDKIAESGAEFYGYDNHKKLSEQIKNAYAAAEKIIDNFDFVVYEQFFFLGKHLAEKYNKPVARIFTAPVTNKDLMHEYISAKGPLAIFKHKWIARAFTKDIAKGISLKTDNWLDEIIYNPPGLNLVYTLREYQPYVEEFSEENFKFLGPSIYNRKEDGFDFEIVCPYCNYEFIIDMAENKTEIECPECKNTIELDWTGDVDNEHHDCSGDCHGCHGCNDEDDDM